jgi:prepilin-type processing-associated H-X9-DG protein
MIDHKIVGQIPINNNKASFVTNETPFTSNHPGGVNVSFCDGSVHFLTSTTSLKILQMMATRAGGEVFQLPTQ